MPLEVWTARIDYPGPDRLDITRDAAHNRGLVMGLSVPGAIFAPSWALLNRAHRDMEVIERERAYGRAQRADHMLHASWERYMNGYREEMRTSYRTNYARWREILDQKMVTLCCFCVDPDYCHRTLLGKILERCGAVFMGERSFNSAQMRIPGVAK